MKRWLMVRRFRCSSCHALHTELPDCLIPYKHYQTEIISGVIDGVVTQDDLECEDYPCFDTMRLWMAWFTQNLQRTTSNWLEQAIQTIYNSGGFLVPVQR